MKRCILAAIVVGVLWPGTAGATPITYTFQGTFTSSNYPGISVGDSFSGIFVYDPATESLGPPPNNVSQFHNDSGSISVSINGTTYQTLSGLDYTTINDAAFTDVLDLKGRFSPTSSEQYLRVVFYDSTRTVFSSNASTAVLPMSFSGFDSFAFMVRDYAGPVTAQGAMTFAPQTNGVPDPASTLLLLGATVTGMAAVRRRWR